MFKKYRLIYCLFILIKLVGSDEIVETTHGRVKGTLMKSLLRRIEYYAYMGIPYARPPVKQLRFLPPQPVAPWDDVLVSRERQPCVQYNTNVKRGQLMGVYGAEDCLYLDIFTPRSDRGSRPLLVFLHNEFLKHSYNKTKDYSHDFFIEEDVVIATISHRLSVFGFLSLEDSTLQGNSGLKDIVAGLKWIKSNAERFGGDPNRITVIGSQGGAAAVDLLIHSDARRLFNSVILQGGSALTSMYLQDGGRERATRLASELEIGPGTSEYLLNKFSEIPAQDLLGEELKAAPEDYNKEHQRALATFGPIVEGPDGLVTDYPERSKSTDVSVMIGFNSREGLEKAIEYLIEPRHLSFVNKDFVLLFPERVDYRFDPDGYYEDAVDEVKKFYFKNGKVTIRNVPQYVTYLGDLFTKPIDATAKLYANISSQPVYYYCFDYHSDLNENKNDILKLSQIQDGTWGAASGDELCYLFRCPRLTDKYLKHNKTESAEITFLRKMVRMWSNFARQGNPTPDGDTVLQGLKWPVYTTETKEYLHINNKNISVKRNLNRHRFQFWDNFVEKWRQKAVNGVVTRARKTDEF